MAANKCDLPKREVSSQEVRDIAREYTVPVVETSAKTRQGVVSIAKHSWVQKSRSMWSRVKVQYDEFRKKCF